MRSKPFYQCLAAILLAFVIMPGIVYGLDFEVKDIVQIGSVFGGGLQPPMQWSPDGQRIAYFNDGFLMIADTAGDTRQITKIEWPPRRFRWIDNDEIFISQRYKPTNDSTYWRLIRINIITGEQSVSEEYRYKINGNKPTRFYEGPHTTVEGNAFYYLIENNDTTSVIFAERQVQKYGKDNLSGNHILRTGIDGLYLIRTDFSDSISISKKPYKGYMGLPISLNPNRTHIMFGGNIVRLSDDNLIILDTMEAVMNRPEGTDGCGFGAESFNPIFSEVAFRLTCDDGHSYIVRRIGVFDYTTYDFTILDTLVNLQNCTTPVYAPDGKRIAFVSDGKLYFLNREIR